MREGGVAYFECVVVVVALACACTFPSFPLPLHQTRKGEKDMWWWLRGTNRVDESLCFFVQEKGVAFWNQEVATIAPLHLSNRAFLTQS